jgi:hypothetical protein
MRKSPRARQEYSPGINRGRKVGAIWSSPSALGTQPHPASSSLFLQCESAIGSIELTGRAMGRASSPEMDNVGALYAARLVA